MASFRPIGLFVAVVIILSTQTSAKPIEATNDNNRPIIGILAQEITPGLLPPGTKGQAYIAASYVKYIESAGGRVVPILTTFGEQELEELFPSLNGVLFPGGDANLFSSKYYEIAKFFHEKAVAANSKGDFFPIWGTCLGFQTLASITAGKQIVTPSNAVDISLPLNFSANAMESRILKDAPKDIMMVLEKEPVTYNWHFNCVTPDTFSNNKELREGFRVLSYNNDIHGKKFISTMEGKNGKEPVFGLYLASEQLEKFLRLSFL